MKPANSRLSSTLRSVDDTSSSDTNSKYVASVTVSGMPFESSIIREIRASHNNESISGTLSGVSATVNGIALDLNGAAVLFNYLVS